MVINKNTTHYKLYVWTYEAAGRGYRLPERTNLCQYVQRLIWMTPLVLLYKLMVLTVYTILLPIVFLFGFAPNYSKALANNELYYHPFPGLRVWGQVRLHTWVVALPALFLYLEYLWFHYYAWYYPVFCQLALFILLGGMVLYAWFDNSPTKKLVGEWVSSKKQGICPVVEFTEKE